MRLYEIPSLWRKVLDDVDIDPETGEVMYSEEQFDLVEDTQAKLAGTACYIKELQVSIDNLNDQIKRLQARKKSLESKSEWLKARSLEAMMAIGLKRIKTDVITVFTRMSKAPVYNSFIDPQSINPEYQKITYDINKSAIQSAIKANGNEVPAELANLVTMEDKTTLFIKA